MRRGFLKAASCFQQRRDPFCLMVIRILKDSVEFTDILKEYTLVFEILSYIIQYTVEQIPTKFVAGRFRSKPIIPLLRQAFIINAKSSGLNTSNQVTQNE